MNDENARLSLLVYGRVQGVFFRASTLEQAQGLNLSGWVQNLPDGSVEIEAEGSRASLEQLQEWAQRGPPAAEVREVITRWGSYRGEFQTFRIR